MKKSLLVLSGLILPLVASAAVSVEWVAPENYRDAYANSSKSEKSQQMALDDFQSFIIKEASPFVKEGEDLKISVTQLDMTGEFEPWVQNRENVRMMKSPYFGKITFNYVLTNADGKVIKEGEEDLTNQMLNSIDMRDKDAMDPYLRDSLRNWMRSTLKHAKKADSASDKSCGEKK